jgi:hypothetical protein
VQTLNVGAGRTDKEHRDAEEQRRADLLADSRSDANYFFWAAGLSAIASGLFPVRKLYVLQMFTHVSPSLFGHEQNPPKDAKINVAWPR